MYIYLCFIIYSSLGLSLTTFNYYSLVLLAPGPTSPGDPSPSNLGRLSLGGINAQETQSCSQDLVILLPNSALYHEVRKLTPRVIGPKIILCVQLLLFITLVMCPGKFKLIPSPSA